MSYVSYLLVPRIPTEKSNFKLVVKDNEVQYKGPKSTDGVTYRTQDTSSLSGLLLSVFFITGMAILVRRSLQTEVLSWPQSIGLSLLLLMALALLSVMFLKSTKAGFFIVSCAGLLGWGRAVFLYIKGRECTIIAMFRKSVSSLLCSGFHHLKVKRVFLFFIGVILVLNLFWSFFMSVVVVPDDWDAWAIWVPKAKVLALGHGPLHDVTYFGHSDYPLLWPSVWAFSGWCAGGWEKQWSRGWGPVFMLLSAWMLFLIIRKKNTVRWPG